MTRGFANEKLDPETHRAIAGKGGRVAHQKGVAHEFTEGEARRAGRLGGIAISRNRQHMTEIGRRGGLRKPQEESMIEPTTEEINRNPSAGEEEDQPTRASSQPALPSKYSRSPQGLSWEVLAKLVGVEEAGRIYGLFEAATTYHPPPESIAAALECLRGEDWPSKQEMQMAGPALVTWLRRTSMGRRPDGRSADAFRMFIRSRYSNDYYENLAPVWRAKHTRTDPRVVAELKAQGKKRCPLCTEIKPLAEFTYASGSVASACKPCRRAESAQTRERKRKRKQAIFATPVLPTMPVEENANANGN